MRLVLPWPPKGLTPHAKGHWRGRARATASYRKAVGKEAMAARVPCWPEAVLTVTAHPPDLRRRDCQNLPSLLKPAIDGIADAMGCDDHGFRVRFPEAFGEPDRPHGSVVVEVGDA